MNGFEPDLGDIVKLMLDMPSELREQALQEMENNKEMVVDLGNNDHHNRDNDILKAKEALERVLHEMPYLLKDESVEKTDRGKLIALVTSMQWAQSIMNGIKETNTVNIGSYLRVALILEDMNKTIAYLSHKYPRKFG
ncbi:MAG: hypothetical protein J6U54_12745 [Clostridiales bacterium]|nr:hypothetical protein [Clostridiales bacterium]